MRLGATDFLAKPFTPTELISRLNLLGLTQKQTKRLKSSKSLDLLCQVIHPPKPI